MNSLEDAIGPDAFVRLVGAFGGADLVIPTSAHGAGFDRLVAVLGSDPAAALVAWGGGCRIYVPCSLKPTLDARVERLAELRSRGLTYAEIALQFTFVSRYTERHVRRLLSRMTDICPADN